MPGMRRTASSASSAPASSALTRASMASRSCAWRRAVTSVKYSESPAATGTARTSYQRLSGSG